MQKDPKKYPQKYARGITVSAFDLCHAGHVAMLKDCKNVCEYLIIGLQNDPSELEDMNYRLETGGKPKNKPIMSLDERMTILEGIKYVDEIFVYTTEEDLYNKLQVINYDVRILGSDWKGKKYTGHDLNRNIYFHERDHRYSTTELRERVHKAEEERLRVAQKSEARRVE